MRPQGRWRTDAHLVLSSELNSYLDSSKLSGNCAMQQFVKCAGPKVGARTSLPAREHVSECTRAAAGLLMSRTFRTKLHKRHIIMSCPSRIYLLCCGHTSLRTYPVQKHRQNANSASLPLCCAFTFSSLWTQSPSTVLGVR